MNLIGDNLYVSNTVTQEVVDKVKALVEERGYLNVLFDVTGRTRHHQLSQELSDKLPQLDFNIGYNYVCSVNKMGWRRNVDSGYTVAELREIADELGIQYPKSIRKFNLITRINDSINRLNSLLPKGGA